jgi:hypothetical protein
MRESGLLDAAVCVGIASEEGPPEISAQADVVVGGLEDYLQVLRALL